MRHGYSPNIQLNGLLTVVGADGLTTRGLFRLPDPHAVIMVDAQTVHTTRAFKKTMTPYWNEKFDACVSCSRIAIDSRVEQRRETVLEYYRPGL